MLKDHLGNVRVVITDEQQQDVYPAATLEPALVATESGFYTIDQTKIVPNSAANYLRDINNNAQTYQNNNLPLANNNPSCGNGSLCTTDNSGNVYKLNGSVNNAGLGITLRVMAGDKIDVLGKSYYYQNNPTPNTAPLNPVTILNILSGFLGGATGGAATNIHGAVSATDINTTDGTNIITNGLFTNQNNQTTNTSKPRAFLNYIFFDDQFKAVASGASVVGNNKELKNHLQDLQGLVAPKNGFLYVYASNETDVDVFFDNVQVKHVRSSLLSEDHYYPFGLKMDGISSRAAGSMENKRKWNVGSELNTDLDINLYETFYRSLDPQVGRFWQVDPKPTEYESPYVSMGDNPISNVDPKGDYFFGLFGSTSAQRKAARAVAAETGGEIHNITKKSVSVTYVSTDAKGAAVTGKTGFYEHGFPTVLGKAAYNEFLNQRAAKLYGTPASGRVEMVDDPITMLGPALLRGLLTKILAASITSTSLQVVEEVAAKQTMTTVGRWMSKAEYEAMKNSGRVVEGAGGQTFVSTGGPTSFTGAAKGSVYAEFQVPSNSLIQGGQTEWFKMIGPNSGSAMQQTLIKQGGEMLPQIQNLTQPLLTK
jgi:RHS repeat-associated protein